MRGNLLDKQVMHSQCFQTFLLKFNSCLIGIPEHFLCINDLQELQGINLLNFLAAFLPFRDFLLQTVQVLLKVVNKAWWLSNL